MSRGTLIHKFAERLRNLREERNLSQEALASKARLDPSFISALERATKIPSLTTLESLANGLKVKISVLVDFHESSKPNDRAKEELALIISLLEDKQFETLKRVRKALDAALSQ